MGKQQKLSDQDLSTLERRKRDEVKRLQKLLNSAISKGNLSEESKLCNTLGEILAEAGLLQLGLRYHMQDLEISGKHGKPLDIAVAHRKVGEVYAELGEFAAAISHQEQYMQITESQSDLVEQQRAHATLGHTYYIQLMSESHENTDQLHMKSAKHYSNAMKLTSKLREKRLLSEREIKEMRARLYLNIGLLYDKVTPTLSTQYLEKALREAQEIRDSTIIHLALLHLTESNLAERNLSQALSYAEQAVKSSKSGDNGSEIAASCEVLALVNLHSHNILQARTFAKQALQNNTDMETAMTVYKVTKLIMSTQQVDFGEDEAALEILSKISDILMKLSLFTQAIKWLGKELVLAHQCSLSAEPMAAIQAKLGKCYTESGDVKLALYQYTQQISLAPCSTAWSQIALLSLQDNQSYEDCWDAVQAGIAETRSPQDQVLCLNTLLEIAEHFGKEGVVASAKQELDNLELSESESCTLSQNPPTSDVEISESESETVDDESETRPVRGKRNTLGRVNDKGETPLHQAAVAGNVKKVRELLAKHASPNTRDHAGWTPLHEACNYGYIEIVELLVLAGADLNDRGGKECGGTTPLHDAAQWGNLNIVRFLIEKGAHVLAKDEEGRTALHLVETVMTDDPDETNHDNRLAIKQCLVEATKNPRKVQPTRRVDSTDLFTTGASASFTTSTQLLTSSFSTSTQLSTSSRADVCRRDREYGCSRSNQAMPSNTHLSRNRTGRVSDSVLSNRKLSAKLPRAAPKKQRSSEPTKHSKPPIVDDWLVSDQASPKRKHAHDPFLPNDKKRSKQSKLPTRVVIKDESSSPELAPPAPATRVVEVPKPCDKMVRVKIRVRDTLFLVLVQSSHTMGDIANIASQRYKTTVGLLPKLTLTTCDGALLNSEDIASLLLADGDELVGLIQESEQESLLEKYINTCERSRVEPVFKDILANCSNSLSISRSVCAPKHLECLFTTVLCSTVITNLDISYNKLSKDILSTFSSTMPTLTSLANLNIAGCGISNTSFPKVAAAILGLPLQKLKLDFNNFSSCFTPLLELSVELPHLQTLSARNCSIITKTGVGPELSVKFANCSLTSLDLSQNAISHFPELPKSLKSLRLGGGEVSAGSLTLPVNLENVYLERCCLADTHLEGMLSGLRNLTSFSAPYNKITRDGVVDLLMLLPSLTFLDLSSNPLGCEGIEELSLVAPPTLAVKIQNCAAPDITHQIITTLSLSLASCDISYNKVNYPYLSKHLTEEVRSAVTCHGHKLLVRAVGV